MHLSVDPSQWYDCDKCEFKTKKNENLKRHKKIHVSADAIQWYNCDKCEFKTKWNVSVKRHKIPIYFSADVTQWYNIVINANLRRN
jgi:uncharacterized Zn-finger protein